MFSSIKQVTPLASFSSGFHVLVAERAHLLFLQGKIVCGITTTQLFLFIRNLTLIHLPVGGKGVLVV